MAYAAVATPYATPDSLKQKLWDNTLADESATGDLFSENSGIYDDKVKTIPDSVVMKVSGEATSKTLGMLNRLSGAGQQGAAGELRGNEEAQTTRDLEIFANEWFHGVPTDKYGLGKVKQNPYAIYKMAQPQLSLWAKETRGLRMRQALIQRIDKPQFDTVVNKGLELPTVIHPNFAFAGNDPIAFSETAATYQTAIVAGIPAATKLDIAALNKIEELAATRFELEQVTVNGNLCWVLTIPSRQKAFLRAPGVGTYIELLKDGDVRGENNRAISNVLGKYGNLVLVEDARFPIMTNTTGTLSFQYKGAGRSDDRTLAAAATRLDLGMLLGKGSLIDYEVESLHFEDEVQNYNRNWGLGAFTTQGYTRADYVATSSASPQTSRRNQSSAIIAFKQS